jgi:chemotaxis family two-component system response regulator Rcp1
MHPVDVLLVEDNIGDEFLISLIFTEAPIPVTLHVARDGVEALFKLADRKSHPALVILDLNLPAISGQDVLWHFHPVDVPVVIFSSSSSEADVQRALELGAREFVQKPSRFEDYRCAVLGMIEKWIPREATASLHG